MLKNQIRDKKLEMREKIDAELAAMRYHSVISFRYLLFSFLDLTILSKLPMHEPLAWLSKYLNSWLSVLITSCVDMIRTLLRWKLIWRYSILIFYLLILRNLLYYFRPCN